MKEYASRALIRWQDLEFVNRGSLCLFLLLRLCRRRIGGAADRARVVGGVRVVGVSRRVTEFHSPSWVGRGGFTGGGVLSGLRAVFGEWYSSAVWHLSVGYLKVSPKRGLLDIS